MPFVRRSTLLLAAAPLLLFAARSNAGGYDLHILAKPGNVIESKVLTAVFPSTSINNAGMVAFTACYVGGCGVFTQKSLVAAAGDVIDGETVFPFPGGPVINNSGDVAFLASFVPGGTGIFVKRGDRGKLLVQTGDVIAGKTLSSFLGTLAINDSGLVAFNAQWVGGIPPQFGFFTPDRPLALFGETVIEGRLLTGLDLTISLNEAGTAVFAANFADNGGGSGVATQTEWVAKTGDTIAGITLVGVGASPSISNGGLVAFPAGSLSVNGIFTQSGPVALVGDVIGGRTLTTLLIKPVINNSGEVVFLGNAFSAEFGVFSRSDLVVGLGDIVDGMSIVNLTIAPPALNDRGQIAVHATFADSSQGIVLATPSR